MKKILLFLGILYFFSNLNVYAVQISKPLTLPNDLPQNTESKNINNIDTIDVEKLIKYSSKSSLEFTRRAIYNEENKDYEKAIEDYSRALELTPNRSELFIRRANCYDNLNKYNEAIKDLSEVLAMRPYRAEIFSERGKLYFKIDENELAILDFNKAIELDPLKPDFYVDRGDFYKNVDNPSLAKRDYLAASELYAYSAKNFRFAKNWKDAIKEYDKAILRNPENTELKRLRKECADELEAEIKAAEEAIKNNAKNDKNKKKKLPREEFSR